MIVRTLSEYDYGRLARDLNVEPESLMAVGHVESKGDGFQSDGFPTILFERHKFYKHARRDLRAEWHLEFPAICNPRVTPRGGYGSKGAQRIKFSQAFALDPDAAMCACSWGAFQELGENYDDYGFNSVGEFVDMMKSGIAGQLDIFARSIRHRGLIDELKRKDFAGFARNYNGPSYREFSYDRQMHNAYDLFKRKHIDWDEVMSAGSIKEAPTARIGSGANELAALLDEQGPAPSAVEPGAGALPGPMSGDAPASPVDEPAPIISSPAPSIWERITGTQEKLDKVTSFGNSLSPISNSSRFTVIFNKTIGYVLLALGFFADHWQWILVGAVLILAAIWYLNRAKDRAAGRSGTAPTQEQKQTVVVEK